MHWASFSTLAVGAIVHLSLSGSKAASISAQDLLNNIQGFGTKQQPKTYGSAGPKVFKYLSYDEIKEELFRLEKEYPDLVEVYDAQTKYGLPSPGDCGGHNCLQYVLRITNKNSLPDEERPEVFFSGELHGNERVGPTTLMEFARYLLESYRACDNEWLKRLVDSRSIFIMPTPNALGYFRNTREEDGIDPNRDFPVDSPSSCMETIAARALNELWREHMFQLALTYHGGMQAIAFEWGTVTNLRTSVSPDDTAQLMLGSGMSAFAGAIAGEGRYPHGRLNDRVYPVRGGMEDWGYAASWLQETKPCNPSRFGGYPQERTKYSTSMFRAFNILIECSRFKIPREKTLGTEEQLFRPEGRGDGHIPRNIRLALFMTDLVQPYVQWVVFDLEGWKFAWEVGGAMHVDETYLEFFYQSADGSMHVGFSEAYSGPTRWSGGAKFAGSNVSISDDALNGRDITFSKEDEIDDREIWPYIPAFETKLTLPKHSRLVNITVVAKVDSSWLNQPRVPHPQMPPQSHIVNARTSDSWNHENGGHKVVGRTKFRSDTVILAQDGSSPTPLLVPSSSPSQQNTKNPSNCVKTGEPNPSSSSGSRKNVSAWILAPPSLGLIIGFLVYRQASPARRYEIVDTGV